MKKIKLMLIAGFFSLSLMAQHNYDSQSVIYSNNGKVGIGTSTPLGKLEINGIALETVGDNDTFASLLFRGSDNWKGLVWTDQYGNARKGLRYDQLNGNLVFSDFTSASHMNDRMVLSANGDIGIGTSSPDATLTVKGDIHTQEVRVDLNGAVAPDFVFEADYALRTLAETEKYIRENKHLPEIPSAAEMEEKGVALKAMNLKLLQKIEELTLYTIEQQKLIEAVRSELNSIREENKSLRKAVENLKNK